MQAIFVKYGQYMTSLQAPTEKSPSLTRASFWPWRYLLGSTLLGLLLVAWVSGSALAQDLPPPEDVPEEILLQEVILQGRSPIDGRPMTPEDYAALEQELRSIPEDTVAVNSDLQSLLFQLKILNLLKDILPFF